MDKIYSRTRIKLPKLKKVSIKKRRMGIVLVVILIAIVTSNIIANAFLPIYESLCSERAKSVATVISNQEATKVMQDYTYEDLVSIYKDKNDNITMIKSNIGPINKIISEVGEDIQKRINEEGESQVGISFGSLFGSKFFASRGPKLPLKLSVIGSVNTNLVSEFKEAGINQTLHRIFLEVECEISVLTPFENINESITNQILLAENVVVGLIPNTYYNLNGLESNNAVDVIE